MIMNMLSNKKVSNGNQDVTGRMWDVGSGMWEVGRGGNVGFILTSGFWTDSGFENRQGRRDK